MFGAISQIGRGRIDAVHEGSLGLVSQRLLERLDRGDEQARVGGGRVDLIVEDQRRVEIARQMHVVKRPKGLQLISTQGGVGLTGRDPNLIRAAPSPLGLVGLAPGVVRQQLVEMVLGLPIPVPLPATARRRLGHPVWGWGRGLRGSSRRRTASAWGSALTPVVAVAPTGVVVVTTRSQRPRASRLGLVPGPRGNRPPSPRGGPPGVAPTSWL